MKNLHYILPIIFMFTSCNNDDGVSEPVPEPIIANAKVLYAGDCLLEHMFVELYDPDPNIIPADVIGSWSYTFYNLPEEYRIDDLEINIEYIVIPEEESLFCQTLGPQAFELKMTSIALPTE